MVRGVVGIMSWWVPKYVQVVYDVVGGYNFQMYSACDKDLLNLAAVFIEFLCMV